ncbi:hypothetical protein Taro_021612, partial [Colocasia esculenta]|nr:hypothetical protein [Colocasia esculenta]
SPEGLVDSKRGFLRKTNSSLWRGSINPCYPFLWFEKDYLMAAMAVLRPLPSAHFCPPGQRPAIAVGAGAATATSSSRRKVKPPIAPLTAVAPATSLPKKKVLVPIGMGTEEMEAVILVDVLRRAGADVLVASVEAGTEVVASSGTKLVADASIVACSDEIFDLVALPVSELTTRTLTVYSLHVRLDSGAATMACVPYDIWGFAGGMPGSARLRDCEVLREILCRQADEKRLYGAICAAPAIVLQPWGLLKRKHVGAYSILHFFSHALDFYGYK